MKISVESGHIYWLELPSQWNHSKQMTIDDFSNTDFWFELEISLKIDAILRKEWHTTERIWFHDDIIPKMSKEWSRMGLFYWRVLERIYEVLDSISISQENRDFVEKSEYNLIPKAKNISIPEIIESIKNNNEWSYLFDNSTIKWPRLNKKQQKIRLKWYREYLNIPSCEVLDFTLYKERLEESDVTITVLPEHMRGQQNKVRKLFQLTKNVSDIIVLFHNWITISSSEYWWSNQKIANIHEHLIKKL